MNTTRHSKTFFPAVNVSFKHPTVGGGYILGNGQTDILDENTKLHERADFPFVIHEGYISVSTQKLTSAPNNAFLLEKSYFTKSKWMMCNLVARSVVCGVVVPLNIA